jgi:hypothetical protein
MSNSSSREPGNHIPNSAFTISRTSLRGTFSTLLIRLYPWPAACRAAGLQRYMKNTLGRHSMTARTLSMTCQLTSWVEASKLTVSDDAVVDGEEEPTSGTNAQHHKIQSRTALANAQRRSIHSAGQCTAPVNVQHTVNHRMQTRWDYRAKTVPCRSLQEYGCNRPNKSRHLFLQSTQQPHNRENIGDCSVIDNSNSYVSIKRSSQLDNI